LIANKKTIAINAHDADAHNNLGITLKNLGKLEEAEVSYRQAIVLKPDFPAAHRNLGDTLKNLGKLEEAEVSYRQAIVLKPDFANTHYDLGNIMKNLGKLEKAEASYRQAILLKPDYAEAYSNLAGILMNLSRLEEAEASCRQAIAIKPGQAGNYNNLGSILSEIGKLEEAESCYRKAIAIKPDLIDAFWNLSSLMKNIIDAEYWIDKCLAVDANHIKAKLTKAALRFYQGDRTNFENLMQSKYKQNSRMRSFSWVFNLFNLPELYFNKWHFFDAIVKKSIISRPFYEFGVWRATSFRYLIKSFKKGYGFDTFKGLPEDWDVGSHIEKAGTYSSDGNIPKIKGGEFIVGKFEDTLPIFYSERRPIASVINFDADLYSSTICALNFSKSIMDKNTILIFDEFIINENWEQDEFKALNEFCSTNNYTYEVIAVSFFSKQVAVKLIGI